MRSGFLFDISIFLYFFDQWEKNIQALGGWDDVRSDSFGSIIYPSLQECTDPGDLELFNTGMTRVLSGDIDAPMPSGVGMPYNLDTFFKDGYFTFYGSKGWRLEDVAPPWLDNVSELFEAYVKQKHLSLCPAGYQDSMLDNVKLGSKLTA